MANKLQSPAKIKQRKVMRCCMNIGLFVLLSFQAEAQQNLVVNGGFEGYCPNLNQDGTEIWNVQPWDNIVAIGGGADTYNACAQLQIITTDTFYLYNVTLNAGGFQYAHSGDGYIGFFAVSDPESYPNWREFIQTPLIEPLHAGVRYEVKFYVSLVEKFQYAVSLLGVYFSVEPLHEVAYDILPDVVPQIQSPIGVIYSDKENWMEIRDTLYIPRTEEGGQQWMTIGNFLPDSLSQITFVDSGAGYGYDRSYYYIDDVSVIALDSIPNGIEEQDKENGFTVFPNPATDVLNIKSKMPMAALRLLDIRGRSLLVVDVASDRQTINLNGIPSGVYLLEMTDQDGRRAVKKFVKE